MRNRQKHTYITYYHLCLGGLELFDAFIATRGMVVRFFSPASSAPSIMANLDSKFCFSALNAASAVCTRAVLIDVRLVSIFDLAEAIWEREESISTLALAGLRTVKREITQRKEREVKKTRMLLAKTKHARADT